MKNSKKRRYRLFVMTWLMLIGPLSKAGANDLATITLADQPVRIIRGVTVLKGVMGVPLQKNDMVETGASAAQIEITNELILVMTPETKIYFVNMQFGEKNHPEFVLLSGWIKVFNKRAGLDGRVLITTPLIQASLESGSSILHCAVDKTEIFSESGVQTLAETSDLGEATGEMKIAPEQYAFRSAGDALKIVPRPPKEFISNMPLTFRDPVTAAPDRLKGVKIQPLPERDVNYADISHWLNSNIATRKIFVKRFKPRLKDADFRKLLDAQLGQTVEWKPILHPPPPKPKPKILK